MLHERRQQTSQPSGPGAELDHACAFERRDPGKCRQQTALMVFALDQGIVSVGV